MPPALRNSSESYVVGDGAGWWVVGGVWLLVQQDMSEQRGGMGGD